MNRRVQHRRERRYTAKGSVDPLLYGHIDAQRKLPTDHPNRDDGPLSSSREKEMELLQFVRRTKAAELIQLRLNGLIDSDNDNRLVGPRPGPESMVTAEMMLLAILLAAHINKSYRRTDLSRVLLGLHPDVALAVGLIDADNNLVVPPYKVLARQLRRMEQVLREGWTHQADDEKVTPHNLQWLINRFVMHSIPTSELKKITNVTVDDTYIKAWGEWDKNASDKDAAKDPVVKYLKKSVDSQMVEPTARTIHKNAEKAISKGLGIGPDGRVIYGTDKDARAGWKSRNSDGPAGPYVGYVCRIAVASSTVNYFGDPDPYPDPASGPKKSILDPVTPYVTALMVDPAGVNPGPAGVLLVDYSREIAPNVTDVTADRGFTMKPDFLLSLHEQNLNVFMDQPKNVVKRPETVRLGKQKHAAKVHCGTILPLWTPAESLAPPKHLKRDGKEGALAKWYAKRFRDYAYQLKGYGADGSIRFRTPIDAGKATETAATEASGDYSSILLPDDATGLTGSHKTLTVPVDQLNHWQRIPYGTPAWCEAYGSGRSAVESVNGRLKDRSGLKRDNCQAMGLAPITLSALALVVIYNLGKTSDKLLKENDSSGGECKRPSGPASRPRSGSERRRAAQVATRAPP